MRTLTKKERRKIYLRAAKIIFNHDGFYMGCCDAILNVSPLIRWSENVCGLREFFFMEPKKYEGHMDLWWWANTEKGRQSRILALLFAAEMCND